jgi:hypothetical protein
MAVAGATAGPGSGLGWKVTFNGPQPFMSGNDLMVPFRSVMNSINMPFDYNSSSRTISTSRSDSQILHTVGTRFVYVDGRAIRMGAMSRILNGSVYVPASCIEMMTGGSAYWNQSTRVLRIE